MNKLPYVLKPLFADHSFFQINSDLKTENLDGAHLFARIKAWSMLWRQH